MDGWDDSAPAWIAEQGEAGDFGRRFVLDPVMTDRVRRLPPGRALDVGCGEGRFCRMLRERGFSPIGIDPTRALLDEALRRDPGGDYREGRAETIAFADASFDLVVSYLTLIDIPDATAALAEMARVLRPGGTLLIANLTGFTTARSPEPGWIKDDSGTPLYFAIDRYLDIRADWASWRGIRIRNWHRPLSFYIRACLEVGLTLTFFDEPAPVGGPTEQAERNRRVPFFLVMEWKKPV